MTLLDTYSGERHTLQTLRAEYDLFRSEEPWNHAPDFRTELHEILMACINGRNDLDVIGLTPAETSRYILRIRSALYNEGRQ